MPTRHDDHFNQLRAYDQAEVRATLGRVAKAICRYHASEINRLDQALGVTLMVMEGRTVTRRNAWRRHGSNRRPHPPDPKQAAGAARRNVTNASEMEQG